MRHGVSKLALLTAAVAILLALPALANPGAGVWKDSITGLADSIVYNDETSTFSIVDATESGLLIVGSPKADLCFDPDTGGSAGAARITAYRLVNPSVPTINGSIAITVPSDNSDCVVLVRGTYWVEVTAAPTGAEAAIVSVTGRSN